MKGVFFGFSIFLLSGLTLLKPAFGYHFLFSESYVIPLVLMFLGILVQIDSLTAFRALTNLKIAQEKFQKETNSKKEEPSNGQEATILLGLLQKNGRLLDFVMEDIAGYSDIQVGSVARMVHQGCKEVLNRHFEIKPIFEVQEGSSVTIESPKDIQFLGKTPEVFPVKAQLQHPGWKTKKVHLPKSINHEDSSTSSMVITAPEVTPL